MKFLILIPLVISTLVNAQVPNVKGQDQSGNLYVPNIQVPNKQVTKLNGTTALIETGNVNLVANAGFEGADLSNITLTTISGTCPAKSRYTGTSLSKVVDGKASALLGKDSLSSAGKCQYDITVDTSNVNYAGRMGVASFSLAPYNTTPKPNILPTSINAEVLVDGVKQTSFSNISFASVTSGAKPFTAYYTMGTTSVTLRITIDGQSTDSMQLALLDEVVLGLAKNNFAMFNMDNQSGWSACQPIIITASTTNPTKGPTSLDCVRWRQSGEDYEVEYKLLSTSAGSAGSGEYYLTLPSGIEFDSSVNKYTGTLNPTSMYSGGAASIVGYAYGANAAGSDGVVFPIAFNNTRLRLWRLDLYANANVWGSTYFPLSEVQGLTVTLKFKGKGLTATTPAILGQTDTFSTDSANLFFKSTACTSSGIGCFNTYSYAANTNTLTLCTTAPTQTTSHMNTNGIQIFTRAYNAASTCANPARIELMIGKGMKGITPNIYKSTGKVISGLTQFIQWIATTVSGGYEFYDETTGLYYYDAGMNNATTVTDHSFQFSNQTGQNNGYLVINASKSPVVMGQMLGMARYIVKTYSSGTDWYEVFNDGWVRQGGVATSAGDQNTTVTYTIPFRDTNYTPMATFVTASTVTLGNISHIGLISYNATSLLTRTNGAISLSKPWTAEGYGASASVKALGATPSY